MPKFRRIFITNLAQANTAIDAGSQKSCARPVSWAPRAAGARFPSPVPAKTFPVPADNGFRLHDDEGVQATRPQTIEPDPECPVERCERGSGLPLSPQDRHLMAEGQDLELKLGSGPKPRSHDAEPKS